MDSFQKIKIFFISLAVSLGAGCINGLFIIDGVKQFKNLRWFSVMEWSVPYLVLVWVVLSVLAGIAMYQIGITKQRGREEALTLYLVQLVMNLMWQSLFMKSGEYVLAFACFLLAAGLLFLAVREFWKIKPAAGALLLPYFLWLLAGGVINFTVMVFFLFST